MRQIIGISGFINHGKSVSAEFFRQNGFLVVSFADPLKDMVAAGFGWPRALLQGDTLESRKWRDTPDEFWTKKFATSDSYLKLFSDGIVTPRRILQYYGTEIHRNIIMKNFWISRMEKYMEDRPKDNIVIPDVRFGNEIKFLKSIGATLLWIQRPPLPDFCLVSDVCDIPLRFPSIHHSEWKWLKYRDEYMVVMNDGTLNELFEKLENYLNKK